MIVIALIIIVIIINKALSIANHSQGTVQLRKSIKSTVSLITDSDPLQ